MLGEGGTPLSDLDELEAAARKFLARKERGIEELEVYRALIVALKDELARSVAKADEVEGKK
jgi:hypothetical protein